MHYKARQYQPVTRMSRREKELLARGATGLISIYRIFSDNSSHYAFHRGHLRSLSSVARSGLSSSVSSLCQRHRCKYNSFKDNVTEAGLQRHKQNSRIRDIGFPTESRRRCPLHQFGSHTQSGHQNARFLYFWTEDAGHLGSRHGSYRNANFRGEFHEATHEQYDHGPYYPRHSR